MRAAADRLRTTGKRMAEISAQLDQLEVNTAGFTEVERELVSQLCEEWLNIAYSTATSSLKSALIVLVAFCTPTYLLGFHFAAFILLAIVLLLVIAVGIQMTLVHKRIQKIKQAAST